MDLVISSYSSLPQAVLGQSLGWAISLHMRWACAAPHCRGSEQSPPQVQCPGLHRALLQRLAVEGLENPT